MLRSVPRALLCCWGFGCKCRLEAWAPQRGEDSPAFRSACSRAWPQDLGTRNDSVTAACGPGPGVRTDRGARVAALRSVGVSFLETLSTFCSHCPSLSVRPRDRGADGPRPGSAGRSRLLAAEPGDRRSPSSAAEGFELGSVFRKWVGVWLVILILKRTQVIAFTIWSQFILPPVYEEAGQDPQRTLDCLA